jgi:ubiquitin conjugation factor E4 A
MSNPFLILSDSSSTTTNPYTSSSSKPVPIPNDSSPNIYKDILESILLCTIDEQPSSSSVIYLAELAVGLSENWDKNLIDQALFERLRMTDPSSQLLTPTTKNSTTRNDTNIITENRCLYYLSGCYQRLLRQRDHFKLVLDDIRKLFIDHSKTAISLPDLYEGQDLAKQLLELLIDGQENQLLFEYTDCINTDLLSSTSDEIENLYTSVFRYMYKSIQPLDYFSTELTAYIGTLTHLAKWPALVRIMFRLSRPKTASNRPVRSPLTPSGGGRAFEDTLIGSFLSKSCLPSLPGKPYLFFDKPKTMSERDVEITASTMWQPMQTYQENLSQLFKSFVKNADVRNDVLRWIGECLVENRGKNKEWSSHNPLTGYLYVSDGFLLNLNLILLNLARPFAEPYSAKLLKINPFYAICQNEHVHLKNLHKDTPLIVRNEENLDEKNPKITFNFITEIFFMAHLSYTSSVERLHRMLLKINEELSRVQQAYNDGSRVHGAGHPDVIRLEETMEKGLTAFLNIKTVLNEPRLLELSNALLTATCSWLVHLAQLTDETANDERIEMIKQLPILSKPNRQLSYIPEFIMENITNYLTFLGRFNVQLFESLSSVNEYVTLVLVFMGDASRLRNPHLRAALAEALEAILPNKQHGGGRTLNSSFAETIFTNHSLIEHLPRVLLDVFVSIELTGQAVAFEQKFNYRRPMYEILEYLWKFDKQRQQVKKLASYAEEHIDDAEAPLFLRFINLLMNDANYLLDEALSHMARLRGNQEAMDRGEWNELPAQQRQDLENTFRHTGQLARYTNIMGIKTLIILDMITRDIQSIFCNRAICERLASMLNYFLQHLVGPKRRNLKVRDLNEYQFDPQKLVAKVTDIYLNFAQREEFCAAVCSDGMSYNEKLFPQAVEVLELIRHPRERIDAFLKLGEHIKEVAAQQKEDDEVYDDAPDEYLDPITSTLMLDPVMLPSSRQIIDRATIARHLLSDQSDPFNRNPLRMQDVIPQPELKQTIEEWKASRRRQAS